MSLSRKVASVARTSTVLNFSNGLAVNSRRTLASLGNRGFLNGRSSVRLSKESFNLECKCLECGTAMNSTSHRHSLVHTSYRTLFGRKQPSDAGKSSSSSDSVSTSEGSDPSDESNPDESKDSQSQRSATKSDGDAETEKEPAFDDIVEDEDDDEEEMDDEEFLAIQQRVSQLELELEKYKNALARSQADLINLEHMAKKDTENARNFAIKRFSTDVLGVADALGSAIKIFDNSEVLQNHDEIPELKQMIEGVKLTDKALLDCFHRNGIQKMDALGARFDPNIHEALFQSPNADYEANHVFHVVVDGYTINEHVLRPAKVGVSSGPPPTEE